MVVWSVSEQSEESAFGPLFTYDCGMRNGLGIHKYSISSNNNHSISC